MFQPTPCLNPHRVVRSPVLRQIATTIAVLICSSLAWGLPGDLDPSFGDQGKVVIGLADSYDEARAVVRQPDGKILVAGFTHANGSKDFALVRYLADGTLDDSFGDGGRVFTHLGANDIGRSLALQPDGKILVAGESDGAIALARYLDNGNLDSSFDGDGISVITPGCITDGCGMSGQSGHGIALQPDGKILVAGTHWLSGFAGYLQLPAVARFQVDGTLDTSFGLQGIATVGFPTEQFTEVRAYAMALQSDGKILLAGSASDGVGAYSLALARLGPVGGLDASFGINATGTVTLSSDVEIAAVAMTLKSDNSILVGYGASGATRLGRLQANGIVDTAFGSNGLIKLSNFYLGQGQALAWQTDGKILVAGHLSVNGQNNNYFDATVMRLNANGTIDGNFGSNGQAITDLGGGYDLTNALILQPDGTVLAVGANWDGLGDTEGADFALIRYQSNGVLDTGFDQNGLVTTNLGSLHEEGYAMAVQPDDKILLAGYANASHSLDDYTKYDFALARFLVNGGVDSGFGTKGLAKTDFNSVDTARELVIQPDGRILVAGRTSNKIDYDFALARYLPNGNLDVNFGVQGKVITDFGGSDSVEDMVLQKDGIIILGGGAALPPDYSSSTGFALARYRADGNLDKKITFSPSPGNVIKALSLQADDKIMALGTDGSNPVLVRFQSDGNVDTSFGQTGTGIVTVPSAHSYSEHALALQSDGKILVTYSPSSRITGNDFALTRLLTTGALDMGFGTGGQVSTDFNGRMDLPYDMTLQKDGKILIAGDAVNTSNNVDFALSRFTLDGSLDASFGRGGKIAADLMRGSSEFGKAVVLQSSGKILVGGHGIVGKHNRDFALARFIADWWVQDAVDPDFGDAGRVITPLGNDEEAEALALDATARILVAGSKARDMSRDFVLARYLPTGAPDASFGAAGSGTQLTDFNGGDDRAYALARQPDGTIVLAGSCGNGTKDDFALARYLEGGTLDPGFGNGGRVTTTIGTGNDRAYAVTRLTDGKLLVGGASGNSQDFALARYQVDGSLDTGFDTDGKVITSLGTGDDYVQALAIQADDKILAAGGSWTGGHWDFALTRYLANGTLDTNFGTGGKVITALSPGDDAATALAVQADGKILVAGWSWVGPQGQLMLARYQANGALDTRFGVQGKYTLSPGSDQGRQLLRQFALNRYPDNSVLGSEGLVPIPVPQQDDVGKGLLLQPDGKILMAGRHFNGEDRDLALMRFPGVPIADLLIQGQTAYNQGARFLLEKDIYKYGLVDSDGLATLIGSSGALAGVPTYNEGQLLAAEEYFRWVLRHTSPSTAQAAQALAGLIHARLARIKKANFVWDFLRKEGFIERYTDSAGADTTGRIIGAEINRLQGMITSQQSAISTLLDLWGDPLVLGPGELLRGDYVPSDATLTRLKQETWQLLFSTASRLAEGGLDLGRKRLLQRFFSLGGADVAESRAEVVDELQDLESYLAAVVQMVSPYVGVDLQYAGESLRLTSRLGELRQLAIMTKQGYNPFGFVTEFVPFLHAGPEQDNLFTYHQLQGIAKEAVAKAQEMEGGVEKYLKDHKGFAQTRDEYALRLAETQASYTQRLITLLGSFTHQGKTYPDYLTFLAPDRDLDGDNVSEREKLRGDLVAIFANKGGIQFGSRGQIYLQYQTIETTENRAQQAINDIGNLVKQMEYREQEAHEIAGVLQNEAENIFEITTGTGQKVGLLIRQKARLEANAIRAQKAREQSQAMFSSILKVAAAAVITVASVGTAAPAAAVLLAETFAQDAVEEHIGMMTSMAIGQIIDDLSGEDPAQTALARGSLDAQIAEVQAMERAEITLIQAASAVAQQLIRTKFQIKELALQQANLELSYLIATRDIAKEWTSLANMQGEATTLIADLKRMEELLEQLQDNDSWLAAEDVRDVITNIVLVADRALFRAQAWTFVALRALEYYLNLPPQAETRQPHKILMDFYDRLYLARQAQDLDSLLIDMAAAATSSTLVFNNKTTSCTTKGTLSLKYDLLADTFATFDTSGEPVTVDNGGENQFFFRDPASGALYTGELAYQALFRQALREGLTTRADGKRVLRLTFSTHLAPNNNQSSYIGSNPYYVKSAITAKISGFTHGGCDGVGVPPGAQGIQVNLVGSITTNPYVRLAQMGNSYLKHSAWTSAEPENGRLLEKLTVWSQYEQLLPTWLISDLGVVANEQTIGSKVSDLFQTLKNGLGPGGKSLAFTDRSVANDRWELVIEEDEAAPNAVFIKGLVDMLAKPIPVDPNKDYLKDIQLWVGWVFRPG